MIANTLRIERDYLLGGKYFCQIFFLLRRYLFLFFIIFYSNHLEIFLNIYNKYNEFIKSSLFLTLLWLIKILIQSFDDLSLKIKFYILSRQRKKKKRLRRIF